MNRLSRRAAVLALSLFPLLAPLTAAVAEPPAPVDSAVSHENARLAGKFLNSVHMRETAEAWGRMLLARDAVPQCGCGDKEVQAKLAAAWRTAVVQTFDAPRIFREMQAAFATSLTSAELGELIAFRESPFGRKIAALELPPSEQPDQVAAFAKMAAAQKRLASDLKRKKALEELATAMGGVEALVDIFVNISLGTALGAQATLPEGQPRQGAEEIMQMVEASRPMLRTVLGPMVLYNHAIIYETLTTDEIARYRDVLASPIEQKSVRVVVDAFNSSMREQALAIGARLLKEFTGKDA